MRFEDVTPGKWYWAESEQELLFVRERVEHNTQNYAPFMFIVDSYFFDGKKHDDSGKGVEWTVPEYTDKVVEIGPGEAAYIKMHGKRIGKN